MTSPESTVRPLTPGASQEIASGLVRPVQPVAGIVPTAAAKPAFAGEVAAAPAEKFNLVQDLSLFARVLRRAEGGRLVLAIFVASIFVTIANMLAQVRLNVWNGQFFDAVGRKDLSAFVCLLWTFIIIIAVLLALTVGQTFLQERLKFRLREWIARHLLVEWLKPMRIYQLSFAGLYGRNPDQRIQEDTRLLGDYSADLDCGIVYSLLQIVAFVGVLWALSAQVTFRVAGYEIAIPGYMVWCALAYALIGSALTWLVGRPLIALNGERYVREAEFRFALVRVNESGESIALHGGEKDERRHLEAALAAVVDTMRRISSSLAQLTWITSGTGWLSLVVPILVAAPAYFGGALSLGGLIMVAGAFAQVQGAMRWFVDNFSRLADWRAAIHRVALFREALDDLPAGPTARWHNASVRVALYGGGLSSISDDAVFSGGNAAAVQRADGAWEVMQFAHAELVGERTYLLSRLLRGQGGSEQAMGVPLAAGAPFVLLDDNVAPIAWGLGALERNLQLRVVAANRDHGDTTSLALTATPQATALMPLAPVHVKAARDGSGVTFSWIRRTRIDGDSWVGEVPLGEDSEQYALDILSGGSVVRTLTAAAPTVLYASADEVADFGAAQSALHVRVAQLSATVGRGFAADVTLTL